MITRNNVISSLIFKFIERFGTKGVAFIVNIVLARMLLPSDYGALAILYIFITISQVFVQSGLGTSLIQKKEVDDLDYSSVFFVSFGIAVVCYIILFFIAPIIAEFYKMPILVDTLRVIALILIPGAYTTVQNAIVSRNMQFGKLMVSSIIAAIVSGIIGIILAYFEWGLWALVIQQIVNQFLICIILCLTVKWRPKFSFSLKKIKEHYKFGWKILCSSLIDIIYQNLRTLLIGKKYSAQTLGYYDRGQQFPQVFVENINGSIQSVMFPALASQQEDKARMKAMMRRSIVMSAYIVFPMMFGLIAISKPLVIVLLTDKWLPCVPYLCIACISFLLMPIHTANIQAINAKGRSDVFLKLEVIKKTYGIAILLFTVFVFNSPIAIAIGGAISNFISSFVNAYPNKKLIGYSYSEQITDIVPSLAISIIMGGLVYSISYFLNISNVLLLITQIISGIMVYIGLSKIIKLEPFEYLQTFLRPYFDKMRKKFSL